MLRSLKSMWAFRVEATDDDIGKVHDFFFDDDNWTVRYVVVDTRFWLPGRKVLVPTQAIVEPDWDKGALDLSVARRQVEGSPELAEDEPLSRAHEAALLSHYGCLPYWEKPLDIGAPPRSDGPRVRSTREMIAYRIEATDDDVGFVDDFVIDDEPWIIRFMVGDTMHWVPGGKVLLAPEWIRCMDYSRQSVEVDLTAEAVKNAPEYDPSDPVNRTYETRLYDYYGRAKYWES